jgi:hypothetical protein
MYNFWLSQGLSPDEASARVEGRPLVDMTGANFGGQPPAADDATLREELQKNDADRFTAMQTGGTRASSVRGDLEALRELSRLAPEGPLEGRFAQMFPEFNDIAAARNAIQRRVAPTLRVEGSGSTSDIEYNGMIEGLGTLPNSREVNVAIADMMLAKAELDIARAGLITRYQTDPNFAYSDLLTQLGELDRRSIMPDSLRGLLRNAESTGGPDEPPPPAQAEPPPPPSATPPVGLDDLTPEERALIGR